MSKINIIVSIKNDNEDTKYKTSAIFNDEIIKYQEENKTLVTFNYKENKLIRENDELRMEYIFNKEKDTTGVVEIKELNKKIDLKIKTNRIERKKNDIEIEFIVESNKFLYHIEEEK